MGVRASSWEVELLSWAYEALDNLVLSPPVAANRDQLDSAYAYCHELTRVHSRTFHLASSLLPPAKCAAVRALYAFCRVSDDIVDRAGADPLSDLDTWRRMSLGAHPDRGSRVALAWADARARYGIPPRYAEQLIDGVARDLCVTRYQSFEELAGYCYGVASTVGLMAMHIIGYCGEEAVPYAIKLGVALQLTNILRDVGEDWRLGRVYLPQDELAAFGLTERDLADGRLCPQWEAFLRFQVERTRRLYREALPGIAMLHPDGRFAIAAAAELYGAILEDIERHGGDVFHRRAHISAWGKLRRLPRIWRQAHTTHFPEHDLT